VTIRFNCKCGISLNVNDNLAGKRARCASCGESIIIPQVTQSIELVPASIAEDNAYCCPICQCNINHTEKITICPQCKTGYHADCWNEIGGCAIYGCPQTPVTEHRTELEIPPAYWGQENKPCPACGAIILASAIRCRNCGATFQSSRPQDQNEYNSQIEIQKRLPELRRAVILIFIFCIIPLSSPIAAVIGGSWYFSNRNHLNSLPTLYSAITKLALLTALGQTVFIVIIMIFAITYNMF